jgi:hypothetical protein
MGKFETLKPADISTFSSRNRRTRFPVSVFMLSLLIVFSTFSWSSITTSEIHSQLLPSALAKSYERNTVEDRLALRYNEQPEAELTSHPSVAQSNTTPMIAVEDGGDIINAAVINPGDLVHTMWAGGFGDILHKRDGADFDPSTVNLSSNPAGSFTPEVAVSGDNVYVVWSDATSGSSDIFYKRSTDRGGTFDAIINLSDNAGDSNEPAIAVSGNTVHVIWQDGPFGSEDILYRRSTDGGATFTDSIKNLSDNTGRSLIPAIAASGSSVHVVWADDTDAPPPFLFDILYRRSTNGGSTFPNVITNISSSPTGQSLHPSIGVLGNNVHVVWTDDTPGNDDILYRRSTDGGVTFTDPIKNLSNNAGASMLPAIAVSGNNVHVVWQDDTTVNFDILYRRSLNGGTTFPNIITNLSDNGGGSVRPALAVAGTNVYVVWQDDTGLVAGPDILYRPSTDSGVTFDPTITNVSATDPGTDSDPSIAVSTA